MRTAVELDVRQRIANGVITDQDRAGFRKSALSTNSNSIAFPGPKDTVPYQSPVIVGTIPTRLIDRAIQKHVLTVLGQDPTPTIRPQPLPKPATP